MGRPVPRLDGEMSGEPVDSDGSPQYDSCTSRRCPGGNGTWARINAHKAPIKQLPLLMDNIAGRDFLNVAEKSGAYFRTGHPGRGAAAGDLDRDGDLDLVVSHINQPVAVLQNQGVPGARSLTVKLIGTRSPRSPVGAFVRLITTQGSQIRQWRGGGSFASTSDTRFVFGIPNQQNLTRLEVHWPSGLRETIPLSLESKWIVLVEGAGQLFE